MRSKRKRGRPKRLGIYERVAVDMPATLARQLRRLSRSGHATITKLVNEAVERLLSA